jgi:hypothetical protein
MAAADGQAAPAEVRAPIPDTLGELGRRGLMELALPGIAIGLLGGLIAGGAMAAGGLSADVAVFAAVTLAVLLALAGGGFELVLATGRFPLSALTPVALYWVVAFPLVRVIHAGAVSMYAGESVAVPHGWLDFIVYQALLSVGFGIGYWWLHENFAPRWWLHIRDRNPIAARYMDVLLYQIAIRDEQEKKKQERQSRRRRKSRRDPGG